MQTDLTNNVLMVDNVKHHKNMKMSENQNKIVNKIANLSQIKLS